MSVDPPIHFPDLPRSELERSIEDLVDKAKLVLATQGRLRSLLAANRSIGEELDLPVVLQRVAHAAVDLVGARCGALAVMGPEGDLEEFVSVGFDDDDPHSPELLATMQGSASALEHPSRDPRSIGFPDDHPPLESFLAVPIRVRGEAFGNLYVCDRRGGPFSGEDEELLTALATSAAIAIDNARLFGETQRRQRWAIASAEVSAALLDEDGADPLSLIAEAVAELTEASLVLMVMPVSVDALAVEYAWGEGADAIIGRVFPREDSVSGTVIDTGHPVVVATMPKRRYGDFEVLGGPAMMVPLAGGAGRPHGALAVARPIGAPRFRSSDVAMSSDFASHASVALELRDARRARERVALLEDRSRIARDLHDNVIQRLFGAGLALHSIDIANVEAPVATKIAMVGEMMDQAVAEIRKSVFALRSTQAGVTPRHRLLDVLGESAAAFPAPPRITFEGHVDRWVPDTMLDDLEAVVREGLANAARHSRARLVEVRVGADERQISVSIADDGIGPNGSGRRSGIANIEDRARRWGGTSALHPGSVAGAVLEWRVPTPSARGLT